MDDVKFTATLEEAVLIGEITDRSAGFGLIISKTYDRVSARMDLEAVHSNGCPLDLHKLLMADDFSFVHDITGIARHIDRTTGKLEDNFLPRCAK